LDCGLFLFTVSVKCDCATGTPKVELILKFAKSAAMAANAVTEWRSLRATDRPTNTVYTTPYTLVNHGTGAAVAIPDALDRPHAAVPKANSAA
jgi:hypothetical protein